MRETQLIHIWKPNQLKFCKKNSVFKYYYNELTVVKIVIYYSTKVGGVGGVNASVAYVSS